MPQLVPIALLERGCKDKCDLTSYDLRVVVALIAAKRTGRAGATCKEIRELVGVSHATHMVRLERERWVVIVGKIAGSNERVWAPSPQAAPRLGLCGWQTLLFTDEELERVDPNEPGFLQPPPVREIEQRGPEIVDTTGETAEAEKVAS